MLLKLKLCVKLAIYFISRILTSFGIFAKKIYAKKVL